MFMNFFPRKALIHLLGCAGSLLLLFVLATAPRASAQQIYWGSTVFGDIVDSQGNTLGTNYSFQLGAFSGDFNPTHLNVNDWAANWNVFSIATYNPAVEVFAGNPEYTYAYFSGEGLVAPDSIFSGKDAYLWILDPSTNDEWFLGRSSEWIFPLGSSGNDTPIYWSVSDMTGSDEPVWGSQSGVEGYGTSVPKSGGGSYTLQTYSLDGSLSTAGEVPELSSSLIGIAIGLGMAFARRRPTPESK
jgi:hypothetical protein